MFRINVFELIRVIEDIIYIVQVFSQNIALPPNLNEMILGHFDERFFHRGILLLPFMWMVRNITAEACREYPRESGI